MIEPWVWAVLLLLLGLVLAVGDIFLPSGGILAFLALCAIVGAIVMAFMESSVLGLAVLTGALIGLPVVVVLALYLWPKTSFGKRILLHVPTSEDVLPENAPRKALQELVGRVGRAKSKMLPSGIIVIDNHAYDASSEGIPVEPGQKIRVIEVRGNRIVVEPLGEEPPSETDIDPLARPVDWDATDPFPSPPA
jgi:membrane-bound ClpP family serine protease